MTCDRSCICVLVESFWPVSGHVFSVSVLVESLWPVIGHVFVCLLNRCCL